MAQRATRQLRMIMAKEDPETLKHYYYQMQLLRRFEERAGEMYTKAKIGGYCHLNLGEEATIIGLMTALEQEDYIFTNYREHGYIIARGAEPGAVMAELFGRETGVSGGRGGSMHLFDAAKALYGRLRNCRRADSAGDWRGVCAEIQGRARRGVLPAGRCNDQHRRVVRVAQPGGAVQAADHLLHCQ